MGAGFDFFRGIVDGCRCSGGGDVSIEPWDCYPVVVGSSSGGLCPRLPVEGHVFG